VVAGPDFGRGVSEVVSNFGAGFAGIVEPFHLMRANVVVGPGVAAGFAGSRLVSKVLWRAQAYPLPPGKTRQWSRTGKDSLLTQRSLQRFGAY